MMTFYAAAGSYQIRNEDGKDMPYIMRLGKLQPVSIPEFSIWSMLLWDVLTHDELRKKYFEKMEEVKLDPSGFEKALEMLVKRKLIIKGVGYTGADALYNMLYDTYVIPLRGVQGTRRLLNIAKLLKQGKVNFFEALRDGSAPASGQSGPSGRCGAFPWKAPCACAPDSPHAAPHGQRNQHDSSH